TPGPITSGPVPPPKPTSAAVAPTPPPASNPLVGNAPSKPPGKGPKTFEEMGVPLGKSDSDCANDISANLHNKVTKSYVAKALKELHESNTVAGKSAGKQTVYHVLQDPNDAASREEIVAMEQEIADLRDQIACAKASKQILKSNLASVNATMSTQDLRGSTTAIEQEKQRLLGRLDPLRSGTVKPVSLEEKAVVDKTWKEWSENARVRKKICLDVWALVTEMLPDGKTRGELWEELGLEADE
ncbi:hypothetical protein MMC08_007360, partial [Hypocenomyce scalaris]|nr:hypothetical protein [Hypocenomyce scalaris]